MLCEGRLNHEWALPSRHKSFPSVFRERLYMAEIRMVDILIFSFGLWGRS